VSEPRVVQGLRGNKDRGDLSGEGPQIPFDGVSPAAEGEAVFLSSVVSYRMTLWVDWDKVTYSSTGRRQPDRRDIQFTGNTYRTKDPREIESIRKSSVYGVTVFDLADLAARAEESRMNAALSAADDPAIAEALKTKLGMRSVDMPLKTSKQEIPAGK
jgi:hypothetical protein